MFAPDSKLYRIRSRAFHRCILEALEIPSSVRVIEDYAFTDSYVKSLVFAPDSKVRWIGRDMFQNCVLETIDVPSSLEYLKNYVQLR